MESYIPSDKLYAYVDTLFAEELATLCYPQTYILPVTPQGEVEREYLLNDQFDDNDDLTWQSVRRYGCSEHTITFEGELYTVILVNND